VEAATTLRRRGALESGLDSLRDEGAAVLHGRAGIDHLVVSAAGVFVVDVSSDGGRVERRFRGGWHSRTEHLYVGGRDRTSLLAEVGQKRDAVASVLVDGFVNVPVVEAICLTDAQWSRHDEILRFGDVHVLSPGSLVALLRAAGGLGADAIVRIERRLVLRLPPA
jgi:hypothetical protein